MDRSTFVCPDCRGEIAVTSRTRRTLLEEGCVFCGGPVSSRSFAVN
ncbi:DUF7560 family zinc ribbon protein [Natronomonas marina]|jgi:hypothetical protein|nr:hypothetical protein [Natronomonas marina]